MQTFNMCLITSVVCSFLHLCITFIILTFPEPDYLVCTCTGGPTTLEASPQDECEKCHWVKVY